MKQILITGMTTNTGGVETFILNYVQRLYQKIHFDFWCNNAQCAFEDKLKELGCEVFHGCAYGKDPLQAHKDTKAFFRRNAGKYSCIWASKCMLSNIDDLKFAQKYGIPKRIIHSHSSENMETGTKGRLMTILHNRNKAQIDKVATDFWACSKTAGRWFYSSEIMNSEKFRVIPNAIDTEKYKFNTQKRAEVRKLLGIKDNETVIGFVGRLQYQKNPLFMLQIFHAYHEGNPAGKMVVVGTGSLAEECKAYVRQSALETSVQFLGERNDVADLYQAMDAFLLPSRFEGWGIVLVEAQAAGLPCVASSNVIPPEVDLTGLVDFVNLDLPINEWRDELDKALKKSRSPEAIEKVVSAGYDINHAAKELEVFFSK